MMEELNPYVQIFRKAREVLNSDTTTDVAMIIKTDTGADQRR